MKTTLLILFVLLVSTASHGKEVVVCPDLANKGITSTFMDGFCNSFDSCTKLFTCRFSAADVSNGSFDKSLKLWGPTGEYLQNQMYCWLAANAHINTNLKTKEYFIKNCLDNGAVYNASYLQGRPYWSEIKKVEPFKTRTFLIPNGSQVTMPFPIRFNDFNIALNHPLAIYNATFGGNLAKWDIQGTIIPLPAGMDIAIIDGASNPADAGENPYKSLTLQPSAAFLDKHKEECAIVVDTSQPVIIQNLIIDGFNKGICVYEGATVIVFNVHILKSKHAILANGGKVLVRNSYLSSSDSAVLSANSKFSNALLVNTKIDAPTLPNEAAVVQDKFYQVPLDQSSSPTFRVTKISDTQAIGKLTWPTAEAASKYGTYDTFVIYAQNSASDNFKELQRVTGDELAEIEKGFLIHNINISGLSDSALFTAVVIKGKISPELSLATREIWFKMVDQDAAPLRSSFAFPANFENTVVSKDHIMHLCQAGETASVQFTTSASSAASPDITFDLKLGEDLRLVQNAYPVSSRQALVLSKEGNEILLKTVPKWMQIYGPMKPYKDGWYWQYMGIKDGTVAKIILNGTGTPSIAIARADDPSPCSVTLTQKPLQWNSDGQIEVLFAGGASSVRLQKNNQPSASTVLPDFGKLPQLGEGFNLNSAYFKGFSFAGLADMIGADKADKKEESAKGDAKAEGEAKKGDDTKGGNDAKDGDDTKGGNDIKGGGGPTAGPTGVGQQPSDSQKPNPFGVRMPAGPAAEGDSGGCSLIR